MKSIIYNGGIEVHFTKEAKDTNNEYCEFLCVIKPGARHPMPHYHENFDETVISEKGTVTWIVDGRKTDLSPGETLFIQRGAIHMFENRTKETIEFRCKIAPAEVFGPEYFEDIAGILNVKGLPDFKRLKDVMKEHGLRPVPGFKRSLIFSILGLVRKMKGAN